MISTEEQIEVMQAHIDGKYIECQHHNDGVWKVKHFPDWDWSNYSYRIAKKKRKIWVNFYSDGRIGGYYKTEQDCIKGARDNASERAVEFEEVSK